MSTSRSALLVVLLIAVPHFIAAQGFSNWEGQSPTGFVCGDGSPYSFFFRVGTNDHVTVFFEGGGACWDLDSCLIPDLWTKEVDFEGTLSDLQNRVGLISADQRSAVVNDTILYLPYCTGDVHTGSKVSSYLVSHTGHLNVQNALDYLQQTVLSTSMPQGPSQVNVMGCSAGSLGAFINAPFVFQRFPAAKQVVWGDSEVGVVSEAQWAGAWNNWGIQLAKWIPGLAPPLTQPYRTDITGYVVSTQAKFYPDSVWGAYTSNADAVQGGFYLIGGGLQSWTQLMRTELNEINGNCSNTFVYIASGDAHCQNDGEDYWTVSSGATPVLLSDWVNSLVARSKSTQHAVDCAPNC